jgi:hypothetical protein
MPVKRIIYDYKNVNFDDFRAHIGQVPFDLAISQTSDINDCCEIWRDLFLTAVEDIVPKKTVSDKNTPPWIDHEVKHLIRKKFTPLRREHPTQHSKEKQLFDFYLKTLRT